MELSTSRKLGGSDHALPGYALPAKERASRGGSPLARQAVTAFGRSRTPRAPHAGTSWVSRIKRQYLMGDADLPVWTELDGYHDRLEQANHVRVQQYDRLGERPLQSKPVKLAAHRRLTTQLFQLGYQSKVLRSHLDHHEYELKKCESASACRRVVISLNKEVRISREQLEDPFYSKFKQGADLFPDVVVKGPDEFLSELEDKTENVLREIDHYRFCEVLENQGFAAGLTIDDIEAIQLKLQQAGLSSTWLDMEFEDAQDAEKGTLAKALSEFLGDNLPNAENLRQACIKFFTALTVPFIEFHALLESKDEDANLDSKHPSVIAAKESARAAARASLLRAADVFAPAHLSFIDWPEVLSNAHALLREIRGAYTESLKQADSIEEKIRLERIAHEKLIAETEEKNRIERAALIKSMTECQNLKERYGEYKKLLATGKLVIEPKFIPKSEAAEQAYAYLKDLDIDAIEPGAYQATRLRVESAVGTLLEFEAKTKWIWDVIKSHRKMLLRAEALIADAKIPEGETVIATWGHAQITREDILKLVMSLASAAPRLDDIVKKYLPNENRIRMSGYYPTYEYYLEGFVDELVKYNLVTKFLGALHAPETGRLYFKFVGEYLNVSALWRFYTKLAVRQIAYHLELALLNNGDQVLCTPPCTDAHIKQHWQIELSDRNFRVYNYDRYFLSYKKSMVSFEHAPLHILVNAFLVFAAEDSKIFTPNSYDSWLRAPLPDQESYMHFKNAKTNVDVAGFGYISKIKAVCEIIANEGQQNHFTLISRILKSLPNDMWRQAALDAIFEEGARKIE